ncbi:PcfJ domain-containing protein, partial [Shigella dysenteriae]|nr:PcfJ domain-containing protein [Shigella dysenteriae]
ETVEVSLKTLEVVQSRGLHNSNTEYHDRIVNLVNSNVNLIRQRMEAA